MTQKPTAESSAHTLGIKIPWMVIVTFVLGLAGSNYLVWSEVNKLQASINSTLVVQKDLIVEMNKVNSRLQQDSFNSALSAKDDAIALERRFNELDRRIDMIKTDSAKNERMLIKVWQKCKELWEKSKRDLGDW